MESQLARWPPEHPGQRLPHPPGQPRAKQRRKHHRRYPADHRLLRRQRRESQRLRAGNKRQHRRKPAPRRGLHPMERQRRQRQKTEHHPPAQTTQTVCQLRRPCRQRPHCRRRSCLAKPHLDRDQKPGDRRRNRLRTKKLRRGQPDEPLPNQRTPLGANQHRQPLRQKIPQPAQLQPIRLRRPALHQRQLQIRILKPLPAQRKPRIRGVFTACIVRHKGRAINGMPLVVATKKTPLDAAFSFSSRQRLQHQRRNPASNQQWHVVVEEGRDDSVLDVVVLAVSVETHCRAEGGVGGG